VGIRNDRNRRRDFSSLSDLFQGERDTLAAADAEGHHSALNAVSAHGVQQPRGEHSSGCTDWVAVCDGAAFDVHDVFAEPKFTQDSERDRRERFIDLNTLDVRYLPSCSL
jgi:hypothetical protein